MTFARFKKITMLALFISLFSISSYAVAAPVYDQTGLGNMFLLNNAAIEIDIASPTISIVSTWNPELSSSTEILRISTPESGAEINSSSILNIRFIQYNNTNANKISLSDESSITIRNFSLVGNSDRGSFWQAAAILSSSDFTLENGTYRFINNSIFVDAAANNVESSGGALYVNGDLSINAKEVEFTSNSTNMNSYNTFCPRSLGGAVYSTKNINLQGGTYTFSNNHSVIGIAEISMGTYSYVLGGAIFARNSIHISAEKSIFENNYSKSIINEEVYSAWTLGGAIYAEDHLKISNGEHKFESNKVESIISGDNIYYTDTEGGAIFAKNIEMFNGSYTFIDNIASSRKIGSANQVNNIRSAGGAVYSKSITLYDGVFSFSGNMAFVSYEASNSPNLVAMGGAIFAEDTVSLLSGTYEFLDNVAQIHNEELFCSFNTWSGGGAIYALGNIKLDGGTYTFSGNKAICSSDISLGCGGAIFASHDLFVNGGTFVNNSASHYGGAIYIKSYETPPTPPPVAEIVVGGLSKTSLGINNDKSVVKFFATKEHALIFEGNMQHTGTTSMPNSIFFDGRTHVEATFYVEKDAIFLMKDPMNSNIEGSLNITKEGLGTWQLGGVSELLKATCFTLSEGTLRMLPGASLDMSNDGSFVVYNNANIEATIGDNKSLIISKSILLNNGGVGVNLTETYFTEKELDISDEGSYVVLEMTSLDNIIGEGNNLIMDTSVNEGNKQFEFGVYKYAYSQIDWEAIDGTQDDNKQWRLIIKGLHIIGTDDKSLGAYAIVIPGRITLSDTFATEFTRINDAFDYYRNKQVWFDATMEHSKSFDAMFNTFRFTAGVDRQISNDLLLGISARLSAYDYEGTDIKGMIINPLVSMYAGIKLPFDIIVASKIGYGFNVISQERFAKNDVLYSIYLSNVFTASTELCKNIFLNKFELTPVLRYEYYRISTNAHEEKSHMQDPTKSFGVKFGDSTQQTHRLYCGLRVSYAINSLEFSAKLFYLRTFGDLTATSKNGLLNDTANELFKVENRIAESNSVNFGVKITKNISKSANIFLEYNGVLSTNTSSHGIKLNLSVKI